MTALAANFQECSLSWFVGSKGASEEARKTEIRADKLFKAINVLPVSGHAAAINAVLGLASNEEGASPEALAKAVRFVANLPKDVASPEPSIDPDGEISLDWGSEVGILSVSIGPTGRVIYAAELDREPISGTYQLGRGFPVDMREALQAFSIK